MLVSGCCKLQLAEPEVTFALVAAAFRSVWWSTKMSTGTRPLKSKPQTYPNIAIRVPKALSGSFTPVAQPRRKLLPAVSA